ncbi:hypothetical protein [Flavobacterium gilvum]|uniref:NIPSNAP domain-containing protein n=1 Tax=Flavobacterium gilvum TaxID=1492737 RepID=A0AAC9I3Y8_9FLAO|nr:hypothetical protein [Flavobacterium gilvum]AOW09919.1 hypothetical protein EM308_10585 [Flavobacterium gilvum]KFC59626.1 hypothetical protein FEM08_16180 [Flavobacterium gilvum]
MYIVREIFYLQFGRYKDAKVLIDEAMKGGLMPQTTGNRVLTDFTGESYRLIFESSYATLADFEKELAKDMGAANWKEWYEKFKALVRHSEREILKQIS